MSLLSSTDLTFMQAVQNTALPGTVVIERHTYTSDGMGGYNEAWAAAGTVTGRIYPRTMRGGAETVGGAALHSHTQWWATFPAGTDVVATDRLLYSGRTWEVLTVNNDQMWQTAIRCELLAHDEELRT